jgi:hypothetical protein
MDISFEKLRPYRDEEIAPAMRRIMESPYFPALAAYVYPDRSIEEVRRLLESFSTIDDFQLQTMKTLQERIISLSITNFSHAGIDKLDPNERYLFISNHRDIVLDSSLLQYALHVSGHRTTEITFGNNLMSFPLVVDIGRSNKMFKLIRGGTLRESYGNAFNLSRYIRYTLDEKRESVWIAQRKGRAKTGVDATDQGIIKMFYLHAPRDPVATLASMRIVPVSVSYTWEPCDILKALECCRARHMERYIKRPGEDLQSILTGITSPKGEVHFHVGSPITAEELSPFAHHVGCKFNRRVATLIDRHILGNYRLTCNNFIAHDLRSRSTRFSSRYSSREREYFVHYLRGIQGIHFPDKPIFNRFFLGIYANPIDARERLGIPV